MRLRSQEAQGWLWEESEGCMVWHLQIWCSGEGVPKKWAQRPSGRQGILVLHRKTGIEASKEGRVFFSSSFQVCCWNDICLKQNSEIILPSMSIIILSFGFNMVNIQIDKLMYFISVLFEVVEFVVACLQLHLLQEQILILFPLFSFFVNSLQLCFHFLRMP